MAWIHDLYHDEIRSGFLVTAHRKRIWDMELSLLAELERVCAKYGLSYYADLGTLLGAVRHQGFIPWDDDLDVTMLRPDYEKLKEVGAKEFQPPFFFQNAYTDEAFYQLAKIRYDGTTGMESLDMTNHQGIFLDIFPLDAFPDGSPQMAEVAPVQQELYAIAVHEDLYRALLAQGVPMRLSEETRTHLLRLTDRARFDVYERFQRAHFDDSARLNFSGYELGQRHLHIQRSWYEEAVRLPFEGGAIAAPVGYEPLLHELYGDYHRFVKFAADHGNEIRFSPDVSYETYRAARLARREEQRARGMKPLGEERGGR